MNEKDTVSSQDIPALVRALGTLALAAATALVIKWFISHDTKEKKTECNETDLQNNLSSKVQDEQTTCDGCLDGVPQNSPSEVSNEGGIKLNVLLEGCHDSGYHRSPAESFCGSQSIISEEDIGQQIDGKEEKTECNKADLQKNLCSKVQHEQTTCDGCLDGVPPNSPSEVSNEGGIKLNVLLEGCHDSGYHRSPAESSCSSQSIISEEDIGQQIDTKEEKTECNEIDLQNNLSSKVQDEQTTCDGCLDGVPQNSPSEVSNEGGIKLNVLLEGCHDSGYQRSPAESFCGSQSIISEEDIGQQIDSNEEKTECNKADLQNNLSSKVQDEPTTCDGCLDGVPANSPLEVSNEGGIKLNVLLESCHDSGYHRSPAKSSCSSHSIISEEDIGQQIDGKEEKTECNKADLQKNLCSKVQHEQTACDGSLDGVPQNSPSEVSNEGGIKLNVLLEGCHDSGYQRSPAESFCGSQSIISEEDIGQQIDSNEEKTECNKADLQNNLSSKVQDEPTTCDGCLDGVPANSPSEVSNEGGIKLNVLLESCHDSGYHRSPAKSSCSSHSIISEEDIGQQIDTEEEKTECNETDLENNLFSKLQDEQTACDGSLDGVPPMSASEVSNEGGIKLNVLLEGCHDSGYHRSPAESSCISQSIISEEDIGQQIDTKEKKTECNEADLQNNLDAKGSLDGVRPKSPSEVSNEGGIKLNVLLEGCHDSAYHRCPTETSYISQSIISEEENGKQIDLFCDISPKKANTITPDACSLNMVVTSGAPLFTQREDGCDASVFTATTGSSTNNAKEDQIFSGCLTHRCDSLPIERLASIQEPECSFGTSSGCGEYINDLNTKCAESQCKLSGQGNLIAESFVQHSTVSLGVSRDALNNGPNEKDGVLNCHSETNLLKHTTYPEKQKYHTENLVIYYNDQDNTLVSSLGISGRKEVEVICNPFASEEDISTRINACIPEYHSVPEISMAQCVVNSVVENDTLHCTEVLSGVHKTLTAAHETVDSAGDICKEIKQYVTLHSRMDSQGTNIYPSEKKITVNDEKVTETPNEDLKHSIPDTGQNMHNNDTEIIVLPLENVLPDKESNTFQQFVTPMEAYTGRYQGSSYCDTIEPKVENKADNTHCYPNSMKELPLPDNQRGTTIYYYVEHNALDLEDHDASFKIQEKHQFFEEEVDVKNTGTLTDLTTNLIPEKSHEDIDVNNKSVELYPTTTDFTLLGTVNSKEVTELIFDVKSISCGKDDTEFQNCDHQEGHNVITNEYLDISHEVPDHSKMIKKQGEHCSKERMSLPSEPCSSLQNTSFPTGHFCKDSHFPLPAMMGTYDNAKKQNQSAIDENDFLQESVNIDRDGQLPSDGDTCTPCSKPYAKDKKNDATCCDSNLVPTQDQNMHLTFNNATNLCSEDKDDITHSREKIMSTIAENPELILPEYQSKLRLVNKRPLMAKSCDNILSGHSYKGNTLKSKAQSMLCLLTEYYSSKFPSENGPVEEVARGSFICIPKSLQNTGEALRFQLTLGNCLELLKLARKNRVQELLKAVYTVISDNYLNVLKNAYVYGQLTGLERERILQLRMRGQLSLCVVETKSIFGLNKYIRCPVETAEGKAQLYSLDFKSNKWNPITSIPGEACLKGCSICSMHNYLFIAGGLQENTEGLTCSNKLFCYNPLTDIWTQLSPMNEGRSQLKLIPLDGYLYAIGGECLHTVEKYDPRLNKWTFVAPLPKGTFAVAHEAAACGGEIYISGGHLFYRLLKYNPIQDQWEECPFNASKGRSCDMVAVGSILYRFDMQKDFSVNILKYNTMAKMWSEYTASFPGSKIPFRCALLEGNIYCINRETTAKFSLECEKAVFDEGVFSKVPTWGAGSPHPIVLCLHGSVSQTSV